MKAFLHKVYHKYINRDGLYEHYEFLQKSQYFSEEELRQYQYERLRTLLEHASGNVPYYRGILANLDYSKAGTDPLLLLEQVPVLTKEIIRKNFEGMKAENLPESRFEKNATSGSTGSNFNFFSDKGARIRQAMEIRCNEWMGRSFDDRELKIWGAAWDVKRSQKIIPGLKQKMKSTLVLSGYHLSDEDFRNYTRVISTFKPYLLTSYPSILYAFALFLKKEGLQVDLKAIKSAGEKLHDFQRNLIEEVFKTKLYDFYGARDMPMVAMQCGHDTGLHQIAENVIIEVLDEHGNSISDGEGDLVITDLHNFVFPFIRYNLGDRARISSRKCSCGRTLPMLDEIIGRTFEVIQFPNGNRVGGTFWTFVMKSVPGIRDFQVIQENAELFTVKYTLSSANQLPDLQTITKNIRDFGGDSIRITYELVESIPLSPGGKLQFVISKIK